MQTHVHLGTAKQEQEWTIRNYLTILQSHWMGIDYKELPHHLAISLDGNRLQGITSPSRNLKKNELLLYEGFEPRTYIYMYRTIEHSTTYM